ncbi:nuclear receptor coactivator 5 isoform X1 [Protopterus annectens]|uniref:nuclear receptor coactivator 5 isoform X1 n=1 Tax=Protopterus annectens TaxID=7888 RepID=UPI001CFBBC40|nr:nuclear receptor coactivator 5 isoform X1 [Protopterus annectens]XP_043946180.1 nuclear receptor coactivator 5 isoform X1 [Protopterus annectens]XP_043946181.1 nuclear receptor coactivator 5 isoform X1 [Protopterus annectens]
MAADRRNLSKAQQRSSPLRRDGFGYGEERDLRRDRSPIRGSPRRDSRDLRETRDSRDGRNPRDARDQRDAREPRDARDLRDARDARDLRDARDRDIRDPAGREPARDHLADRFRDVREPRDLRDVRDARDPLAVRGRDDPAFDRLYRMDDFMKKKDEPLDRFREAWDSRAPRDMEERLKREERRREELCRQYFEELQRRYDNERPVDCSVIVVNKQTKDYAESVGRKVRDLGMVVDLIFLNTEVSLTQALEDVGRGGTPFAIVITQQHQVHRSCTVNILFGTPQVPKGSQMSHSFVEHRNMPLADAMVLVARTFDRYKSETRDKEREDIARQAAKMADEAILQERERAQPIDDPLRGPHPSSVSHPPSISPLLHLLAEDRYVTLDELNRVMDFLGERKARMLRGPDPMLRGPDPMQASMSRQGLSSQSLGGLDSQSSLQSSQVLQSAQPLSSAPVNPSQSSSQQELQAKILSLFNSGVGSVGGASSGTGPSGGGGAQSQSYSSGSSQTQSRVGQSSASLSQGQQRMQTPSNQMPSLMASSSRPSGMRQSTPQIPSLYSQQQNRMQTPGSGSLSQRASGSSGINFDNPSVQKALDTLIQSGPALSHLVSQANPQVARQGQSLGQSALGSYQRHY